MLASRQSWLHAGSLALLLLGLIISGRGLWAHQKPALESNRIGEYSLRIQGVCRADWGAIRRATLHLPDVPLTHALKPVAAAQGRPVFEATVKSLQPPQRFEISLQFENGGQTTARGRLVKQGLLWVGQFEDYKLPLQAGKSLASQSRGWVKQPQWQQPASSGKRQIGGTDLTRFEVVRILPPTTAHLRAEKGHHHVYTHPPEGHHH